MSSASHLPPAARAQEAARNASRRGTGIVFAVMITVLLVALVFAANENDVIGWIIAVIAGGWLLLAAIVVATFRKGAKKFGDAVDSARADVAARNAESSGGTVVVDEDTHSRNLKLDHSFKIVQVQKRVIAEELAKGSEADTEMVDRALETIEITAHNGRDMLAEVTGRTPKNSGGEDTRGKGTVNDDDAGETIEGDIVR
ncbi:phage holin family protein [Nesterenkonia alba]|uniref:phage holin family protein n=1 Tax=Nesterenkonia alba TaxID=515814 RepID=UPI0003B70C5B|nr:phage holin family protein [Nesterenkonia alba]